MADTKTLEWLLEGDPAVRDLGWSEARWRRWLIETLSHQILRD